MPQSADIPAWISLFLGLYALAAGAGEFRAPGGWNALLLDFERSPGLRFLVGFTCVIAGGAIYLAAPWVSGDWLTIAVNVLGGIALAEGLLILAAGDRYLAFARRLLGNAAPVWAGVSVLFGLAAMVAAVTRL
jgi:hypothetical protein